MTMLASGNLQKLKSVLESPVQYCLPIGEEEIPLNPYLGKTLSLTFQNEIRCIHCNRTTKKSYNQGYCFPCCQTLARCDLCIVRPEKCHFHLGTCREPEWGVVQCMIPHIVYLANTSGLKVGITRESQTPTRWIDQGAMHALPIIRTRSRYQSGLVEVALKDHLADKTDWRKMLRGDPEQVDLLAKRDELFQKNFCNLDLSDPAIEVLENQKTISFQYPVLEYPIKINSLSFEKTPVITGTLLGIKGQYLLFESGVVNIRNLTGYVISFDIL